jgi:hypothetical protein
MRVLLGECGFVVEVLEDTSEAHLNRAVDSTPSPLTLGVFVENLGLKASNARRSLQEHQTRLVRGVFRAN